MRIGSNGCEKNLNFLPDLIVIIRGGEMGDSLRNVVLTDFIRKNFSVNNVLVVADGKAELARKLANKEYRVRVIEAKPRFEGRKHPLITYQKGWFDEDSEVKEELIVGMHPDHATIEIILAANKNNLPFVIVPCCILGRKEIVNGVNGFQGWVKVLKRLAGECRETTLKFSGKNLVLYRR